ncbi:MAG: hypothetical protein ACOYXO_14870 [Chloroflexota bacterium]
MGLKNQIRQTLYFTLFGLRGYKIGETYHQFLHEYQQGIPTDLIKNRLIKLLYHAKCYVPYYAEIIQKMGDSFYQDPFSYLANFPILTKNILRNQFDRITSTNLPQRKWKLNTSGGSTGEPVCVVQDAEFQTTSRAISLLFSKIIGKELGEPEVYLWGSERDIQQGSQKWTAVLSNHITNTEFINAFRMSPSTLMKFAEVIRKNRLSLIVAYAESIYEAALFFEQNQIKVPPPKAIITSAGTLFPYMRQKIKQVFQCEVYNHYGSRETGAIACELPNQNGLWVAPWGNYLEIVDEALKPVIEETRGEILITCLSNFAMPLIRYQIGDVGTLKNPSGNHATQTLLSLDGRINQLFQLSDGTMINPGYFEFLLYFKKWIRKFQVIQKDYSTLIFRFVSNDNLPHEEDLEEIQQKTRAFMGLDCQVIFEFVDELPPSPSGKFLYMYSEISDKK